MSEPKFEIRVETPDDCKKIENLHALAFGPGRFVRTANRMREGVPPVGELCHTGWLEGVLVASIRLTRVAIGAAEGLLLGPIVVHPDYGNRGIGQEIIRNSIAEAQRHGFQWIILVGDAPYYEKVGFQKSPHGKITFPGPVDPDRVMAMELKTGSLANVEGLLLASLPEPGDG